MRYRIAVDTGGTFTDVVVADEAGRFHVGKALTTQKRIFQGMEEALRVIAEGLATDVSSLLGSTDLFVYGTTHATNAIIEGTTAKTAFLTTEGFPDILVLREGGKFNAFDFTIAFPEPYIPRRLTFEIRERITSEGTVALPFDEAQAREVLRRLAARDVEAIAVCFLWSTANPDHERRMGQLITEELPGVPYTLSHELNPIVREYRRASSTVIDASLKPLMQRHLRGIDQDLRDAGLEGEILAATSFGGVMHMDDLIERPIYSVRSGPAMAPVAGRTYSQMEDHEGDVIVCDMGGTSFDVSLIRDGLVKFTRETWLGEQFTGHLTGLSAVDVRSIGAGGGSIAWIDPGGLLRVGPQSAGADPGPACYGSGGTEATVTDAALVLGYIDPDYFLGGRMKLDVEAARRAVENIATRLRQTIEETSQGILTVANEHMVAAIQQITINEGVDPRESLVVAGGGASGLSILPIARELGCRRVVVPRTAGALSACGGQYSDIVAEFSVSKFAHTADFDYDGVNEALASIDESIKEFADGLERRGLKRQQTDYFVEARYSYQTWELEVPLARGRFDGPEDVQALIEAFHEVHERVFAVKEPGQNVECIYWKRRLTAFLENPETAQHAGTDKHAEVPERRSAHFSGVGQADVMIHKGAALRPNAVIEGPAVIEEPTTTIVVYPHCRATLTSANNYVLEWK